MDDVRNKELRMPEPDSNIVVLNRIILQNVDLYSGLPLEGAAFKLSYDRMPDQPMAMVCDREGRAEFTLEDAGQYTLEQTEAPSGHKLIPNPIVINVATSSFEVVGDQESDWYDYDNSTSTLTVKNSPIEPEPEPKPEKPDPPLQPEPSPESPPGLTKTTKYVTNNSLTELVKLIKTEISTQSSKILNVTVNHTIDTYTPMGTPTAKKKFYADIPCTQSKTTMNVQISPNDSVENPGLLTYAEPMDGKVRVYFSEQPTSPYIVDSVELTPVTSVISENLKKRVADIPINEKLKFSSGKTFVLQAKNVKGHEPDSVTFASEYIIEEVEWSDGFPYVESNIHKNIMPKYYNELSVTEKNAIICRNFLTFSQALIDGENPSVGYGRIQSYFYAPDLGELNARVIYDFTAAFEGGIVDSLAKLGNYTDNKSRIKTFENGASGGYITTSAIYDFKTVASYSVANVCSIDERGEGYALLVGDVNGENGPGFVSDNIPVNVLPFCDIKGDTLVMKDTDGYWKIVE